MPVTGESVSFTASFRDSPYASCESVLTFATPASYVDVGDCTKANGKMLDSSLSKLSADKKTGTAVNKTTTTTVLTKA